MAFSNSHRAPSSVCGLGSSRTGPQRVLNGLYLLAFAPRRPDSRGCGFHVCKVIFSSSEANEYTGWWQSVTYLDMIRKSRDYVYRIWEYIVPGYIYIYTYICVCVCVCVCSLHNNDLIEIDVKEHSCVLHLWGQHNIHLTYVHHRVKL